MAVPNFFIIGAPKAGTTSLAFYLEQHPDFFISFPKEPLYFTFAGQNVDEKWLGVKPITELETYLSLFKDVKTEKAIGEASTCYLYYSQTAQNIYNFDSKAKIIALLRDPVDRAYSAFKYLRAAGAEKIEDFREAIAQEPNRQDYAHIWHYTKESCYFAQLKYYYDTFPKEQIHIIFSENLQESPRQVLREVFSFLGVDPDYQIENLSEKNISKLPKFRLIQSLTRQLFSYRKWIKMVIPKEVGWFLLKKVDSLNSTSFEKLDPALRQELCQIFVEDVHQLEALLNCNLPHWLR
jgi:hypothetical protein